MIYKKFTSCVFNHGNYCYPICVLRLCDGVDETIKTFANDMQDLFGPKRVNTPSGRKAFRGITVGHVL